MAGDWNFVCDTADRFQKRDVTWTGGPDLPEQDQFVQQFHKERGFQELSQAEYTHDSERGGSRLDCFYNNHTLADQLDRDWGCSALQWVKHISDHRPVSFFRRSRAKREDKDRPFPSTIFQHPEWVERTAMKYSHLLSQDKGRKEPLRRMVLLKEAMTAASENVMKETRHEIKATGFTDKLGATMRFIRAAERVNVTVMRQCTIEYPYITAHVNPANPEARSQPGTYDGS